MASEKITAIIESVKALTVLELSELAYKGQIPGVRKASW